MEGGRKNPLRGYLKYFLSGLITRTHEILFEHLMPPSCSSNTQLLRLLLVVMCASEEVLQRAVLCGSGEGSFGIPCPCSVSFHSEKKGDNLVQHLSHPPASLEILMQNTCSVARSCFCTSRRWASWGLARAAKLCCCCSWCLCGVWLGNSIVSLLSRLQIVTFAAFFFFFPDYFIIFTAMLLSIGNARG